MVVSGRIWQDRRMRQGWVWAVVIAAVWSFSSCSQEAAEVATPDDVLVLEVGGDHGSLRASLAALGREVGAGHGLAQRPLPGHDPSSNPAPSRLAIAEEGSPGSETGVTVPKRQVTVPKEPDSEWLTVSLAEGETLIHVARRYLGDGRRFADLLKWNGWSDRDAHRLKINQPVKIKRSEMR